MKLLTSLALALLCGIASASSVNWSIEKKSFSTSDGSSDRAKGYYVTLFLYSDYDAIMNVVSTWSAPVTETQANSISTYVKSTSTTSAMGAATGTFEVSDPSGTTLQLFAIAWDGASIQEANNYLVSNMVKSDAYVLPDNPVNTGTITSASYENKSWTAIPEPSVALMGLLGLGMLLKRRRA